MDGRRAWQDRAWMGGLADMVAAAIWAAAAAVADLVAAGGGRHGR